MFSKRSDGIYDAYIHKYHLNNSQVNQLANGIMPDFVTDGSNNVEIIYLQSTFETPNFKTASNPCEEYPCNFQWGGLSWLMDAPNSCYTIHFDYSQGFPVMYKVPTACPPVVTQGDDMGGGASPGEGTGSNNTDGSSNNTNPGGGNSENDSSGSNTTDPDNNFNDGNGHQVEVVTTIHKMMKRKMIKILSFSFAHLNQKDMKVI